MAGIVAPQLVPPVPGIPLANAGGTPALPRAPPLPFGADPATITGWVAQDENAQSASVIVNTMIASLDRLSSTAGPGAAGHSVEIDRIISTIDDGRRSDRCSRESRMMGLTVRAYVRKAGVPSS
jgi:hypothetical protein